MSSADQLTMVENDDLNSTNVPVQPARPAVRTKLHVSNFPESCTRRMLTEFFSKFGVVLECAIMWDKYAFIHYGTMAEAQNAIKQASHIYFMGNKLSIRLSTSRHRQSCDWYQHEAEKLAAKLQQGCLDMEADSGNFVETKLYVTNLPENCNQTELSALFEKHGKVLECVIMWNHYAFVHFPSLQEAKVALSHLNGYNFNGKTLVVQLSTSSNRPLPKCIAFENRKSSQPEYPASRSGSMRSSSFSDNSDSSNFRRSTKTTDSKSTLFYRASSDSVIGKETVPNGCQVPVQADPAPKKDWIHLLKTGSLNRVKNEQVSSDLIVRANNQDRQRESLVDHQNIIDSLMRGINQGQAIGTKMPESHHPTKNAIEQHQQVQNLFDFKTLFNNVIFEEEEKEQVVDEFVNDKCEDNDEYENCNSSADIDSDLLTLNEAWSNHNPSGNGPEALGSPVSVSSKSSVSSAEFSWINSMGCLTLDQIPTPPLPSDEITVAIEDLKDMWPTRAMTDFKLDAAFSSVHLDSELLPATIPLKMSVNYNSSESLSSGSRRPSSVSTTGSSHSPSNLSDNFSSDSVISSSNFEETIMNQCPPDYLTTIDRNSTHSDNSLFMNFIEASKNQLANALEGFGSRFIESQPAQQQESRKVIQPPRTQSGTQKAKLTRCKALNYILFPELKNSN